MEASKHYLIAVLHHLILDLSPSVISVDTKFYILSELSKTVSLVRPVFKFSGYKKMMDKKGSWISDPFFAFDKGYQMCLKVYPAGIGDASEQHVSVELYLMKGPHDEKLQQSGYWPLNGNFSITLIDQLVRSGYSDESVKHEVAIKSNTNYSRVIHNGMVKINDLTIYKFLRHEYFHKYSKNDYLYFTVQYSNENQYQVPYNHIYTLNEQLSNQKSSLQYALESLNLDNSTKQLIIPVVPLALNLSGFSQMKIGIPWYSSPFLAFEKGYQICLKVVRERACVIKSELFLRKGPYDERMQELGLWPLRGTFTVELHGNNRYYPSSVSLFEEMCTECFKRVTDNDIANEGFGYFIFKLDNFCTEPDLLDDELFFEIFYNKHTTHSAAT